MPLLPGRSCVKIGGYLSFERGYLRAELADGLVLLEQLHLELSDKTDASLSQCRASWGREAEKYNRQEDARLRLDRPGQQLD